MLGHLDALEKHPTHYVRTNQSFTMMDNNNEKVEADIYIMKDFKPELMELPFLANYSNKAIPDGKKWVPREVRTSEYLNADYLPDVRKSC